MRIDSRLKDLERRLRPTREAPHVGTWQEMLERLGIDEADLPEGASPSERLAAFLGMTSRELIEALKRRMRGGDR